MTTSEPDDVLSLARALLDTVRERDVLRDLCAVINGDGGHMQVAEGTVAAVEAAQGRWHALQARAVAAEQRATEARDRAWHIGADLADWRHRAFAAEQRAYRAEKVMAASAGHEVDGGRCKFCDKSTVTLLVGAPCVSREQLVEQLVGANHVATTERARVVEAIAAELDAMDAPDLAGHIRAHNWAAPEEES